MRIETKRWFAHVAQIERIRASPALNECPTCTLLRPVDKPVCECCAAESRGEYLSDHQNAPLGWKRAA